MGWSRLAVVFETVESNKKGDNRVVDVAVVAAEMRRRKQPGPTGR